MRGEYRFRDGTLVANAFTDKGIEGVLVGAFRNVWPVTGLFVGLCQAVPSRGLTLSDLTEPTIGVNGYTRQAIARDAVDWAVLGSQAGDPFLESKLITFTATGGAFTSPITRLFLTPEATLLVGDVWALSSAIATPLVIDTATPLANRQFNYRVYGI